MATMRQPTPALYSAVLHILGNIDPHTSSMAVTMSDLVKDLTATQAASLPEAIGQVLPLLRNDPDRMRFAAHLAVHFDFFEAASGLVELALDVGDRELKLAAATLCGNPGADDGVRRRVAEAVADDSLGRIRLDHNYVPRTSDEQFLYLQCWPGARSDTSDALQMPVVVLGAGFPSDATLHFAVRLDKAGASVRRLAPKGGVPFWFGAQTVLVCQAPTRSRVLSTYPRFPERQILVADMPTNERDTASLLRRVDGLLTGSQRLALGPLGPEVEYAVWAPDVFTAGVYTTKDAAFLSGASVSSLNGLRKTGFVNPRDAGGLIWSFRELVAVRTWAYLKSITGRRVSGEVVRELAHFAGDSQAVKLGATSKGRVLVDRGYGWVDVVSNQSVLDIPITDIDDVFNPFNYGGGKTLHLLQASENTKLHPAVLNGTPHFKGHRISAKALAGVDRLGRRDRIEAFFPELAGKSFEDTLTVGLQLLAAG